jgi:hypothetical protein
LYLRSLRLTESQAESMDAYLFSTERTLFNGRVDAIAITAIKNVGHLLLLRLRMLVIFCYCY